MRNELALDAARQARFVDDRLSALLEFFDAFTEFWYESLGVNFGDFPMDGGQSLFEYQKSFRHSVSKILKSYQRLLIYFPNDSGLTECARKITESVVDTQKVLKTKFVSVKLTFTAEHEALTSGDKKRLEEAFASSNEANSEFWNEMRPHVEDLHGEMFRFIAKMNQFVVNEGTK